ncbi:hypothetical protein BCR43DRAFT_487841 [Syncephalastrum racemosum]|uniref:Uncharacterized protein n=1 Tax=Syncephalastrum racemosum TaxID=13706 RepID=A0A1X2HHN8_SYNRA|nr:hypothetical protein BCR43DRAFT_487841 [Syncephalastrum racemosum]
MAHGNFLTLHFCFPMELTLSLSRPRFGLSKGFLVSSLCHHWSGQWIQWPCSLSFWTLLPTIAAPLSCYYLRT